MQRRSPFIMNKVLILVIDGCAPEYITPEFAPNIHRLAKQYGFVKTVKAVVPTVTNVNHASCQGNFLRKPAWWVIIITIQLRAKKAILKKKVS